MAPRDITLQEPPREQAKLRALAPKTVAGDLAGPVTTPVHDDQRVKRASQACLACKKRRTKCSYDTRGAPCSECVREGTECIIDETSDRRRKVSAKRTEDHLKYYKDFSVGLVRVLRECDIPDVDAFVNAVRAGATELEVYSLVLGSLDRLNQSNSSNSNDKDDLFNSAGKQSSGTDTSMEMYSFIQTPMRDNTTSDGQTPDGFA